MRRSLVAPLSGAGQCDIVIAIYRISLSFAGNELGNRSNRQKTTQMAATSRSDLHFGPAQNEHPCGPNVRSLAPSGQWSARSTGPPSKKSRRASGQCRGLHLYIRNDVDKSHELRALKRTDIRNDLHPNEIMAAICNIF